MFKIFASSLIVTTALLAAPAYAQSDTETAPTTNFQAAIEYDATAPVEATYATLKKQSHLVCKRQIKDVRTFSIRFNYMQSCSRELIDSAVKEIQNAQLSQYHAAQQGKVATRQFAQNETKS
ncbi:MAG: hypothetical protein AAFP97_08305 [Pseudomonadota bacterium]